ncbi:hypothetical protein KY284_034559 [Solanum tuberosum]|nr:hypothetical protein KY284_034559 [Solanum tuberosum]
MPFGSTCLPNECNLNYVKQNELINESLFPIALLAATMQRIRDRISALEDRKRALLQDMISPSTGEKESVDPKSELRHPREDRYNVKEITAWTRAKRRNEYERKEVESDSVSVHHRDSEVAVSVAPTTSLESIGVQSGRSGQICPGKQEIPKSVCYQGLSSIATYSKTKTAATLASVCSYSEDRGIPGGKESK